MQFERPEFEMKSAYRAFSMLMLSVMLAGAPALVSAQDGPPVGRLIFIPQLQEGLADARARMSDEQFTGCFAAAVYVDDFAKRAKSEATGQTLAEMLQQFVCASSEKVSHDRYLVAGSLTVNGETGPFSSEIIQVSSRFDETLKRDEPNWAVGRFLLGDREIYRDEQYTPAN